MSVHIILPMAGMGRRFKEAGYKTPKPFIHVACRPMFVQVLNNMPERHHGHLHVVTLADPNDDDLEQREMHLRDAGGDLGLTIIRLRELTGGAACTVLEGISGREEDPVTPVIVAPISGKPQPAQVQTLSVPTNVSTSILDDSKAEV